ncbi:unnamed protein product [Cuscuta epithymum]|uniref:Uncharacterized protein n=1 Tax=Cuscuta epithymum TaxID=186058 RepID=A0AAV0D6D9_9ASTE|nr:unnamed protein product [Cuscuta epithymum]
MDPYQEDRLREEVIYLHSLWHQGPPRPQNPIAYQTSLRPINPTQFKRRGNPPPARRGKFETESSDSGIEWPCKLKTDKPPETDAGWPKLLVPSSSERRSLTTEEQAQLASNQAQKAALKAVCDFLCNEDSSDDEEAEDEYIDDVQEGDIDNTAKGEVRGSLDFFVKLFENDGALREYYEKNYAGGEFSCLVCFAAGKRSVKKYKDGLALVQHSISVTKTKRRQAHRAFGQSVCKILGWDINRLPPSIASSQLENKLGLSSDSPVEGQHNDNAEPVSNNRGDGGGEHIINENLESNDGGSSLLEGSIDDCLRDDFNLQEFIMDIVYGSNGEVSPQNKSLNSDNPQDNTDSRSPFLVESEKEEEAGVHKND